MSCNRATLEFEGPFRGDSGVKFVFFTENCSEWVSFFSTDGTKETYSLETFLKVIKKIQRERRRGKIRP